MIDLSITQLNSYLTCSKKGQLDRIGLSKESIPLRDALRQIWDSLFCVLQSGTSKEEAQKAVWQLTSKQITSECVPFSRVLKELQLRYSFYFGALVEAFFERKREGKPVFGERYSLSANKEFRGVDIANIVGNITFVFKDDKGDKVNGVTVHLKKNPYSDRGRKESTKTLYAPTLWAKFLYLKEKYPAAKVSVEDWYLVPDEELKTFEPLSSGKRIATFNYNEQTAKDAMTAFFNAPQGRTPCESCPYCDLCKPVKVRTSHSSEEEQPVSVARSLTISQAKAVNFKNGVAIVVAPAGSGKTFALVERVNELVKSGVNPERILMFTFTKKAAAEMSERITAEKKPHISTIHAFCFDIIQDNAIFFGKNLELETNAERESVLAELLNTRPEIIDGLRYDIDGQYGALQMADKYVMAIRERGVKGFLRTSKFSDEKNSQLIELTKETVKALRQRGLITFDDMISLVNDLFAKRPQLVSQLADYDYIMVDEFQDTSADQYKLIKALAARKHQLMVVGDDDQAIYGFRGGDSKFFKELKGDFPEAKEIFFEDNFRSSQMICDTAKLFVEKNEGRIKKKIFGNKINGVGDLPTYFKDADTSLLLASVRKLMETRKASDIAIISRNNKEANEVVDVLSSADIPCSAPKDYLKDDAVFKVVSALLAYYVQPSNDLALAYLLKFLGVATFPEKSNRSESYEFNLRVNGNEQTQLALLRLESATSAMEEVKKISDGLPKVAKMIGLPAEHPVYSALATMCGEKNVGDWEGLQKLCAEVSAHGDLVRVGYPPLENEIQVLTAHDSKGLQFDAVIIWRTECFSLDSEDGEDRNLMYVASTRAKRTLIYMESPKTRPDDVGLSKELAGHVQLKKWKGGFA